VNDSDDDDITDHKSSGGLSIVGILKVLLITFVLSSALSWFITGDSFLWGWSPWWSRPGVLKSWIVSGLLSFHFFMVE
jgi:hypothetical protein